MGVVDDMELASKRGKSLSAQASSTSIHCVMIAHIERYDLMFLDQQM